MRRNRRRLARAPRALAARRLSALAGVLSTDLTGQGLGVIGVQKRDAPCGHVGGGQLDLPGCPPPAGTAEP